MAGHAFHASRGSKPADDRRWRFCRREWGLMAYEDAQPPSGGNRTAFRAAEKRYQLQRAHRCTSVLPACPPLPPKIQSTPSAGAVELSGQGPDSAQA